MIQSIEGVDAALRAEADSLLGSGLAEVLSGYGDVHVVGSYAIHLMTWRDLDIHIVRGDLDRSGFFELGGRIAELLKPTRMSFRDETVAGTPGLPRGLYWGVYLGDEYRGAWKIDLWAVDPATHEVIRGRTDRFLSRLSEDTRRTIMTVKANVWSHPGYRRSFSSQDIYEAVLDHGIADVSGFWDHLRRRGVAV